MDLFKSLRLQAGDIVAFVGAGGKTSSLRRLVQELRSQMLVVVTTTTRLAREESSLAPHHFILRNQRDLESAFSTLPDAGAALCTGVEVESGTKLSALEPDLLARLIAWAQDQGGVVLVEADGARGSIIKAPADHEPVIPPETTMVVPIIRMDAIGIKVNDKRVHRPEQISRLLGVESETILTIHHLASLVTHASGGMKDIPKDAGVRVLINGVDTPAMHAGAQSLAPLLLEENQIRSVLAGSVRLQDPIGEIWSRTGVVVLAAGESKRFGGSKLLQSWRGKSILRYGIERVLESEFAPVVVVLGAYADDLRKEIDNLPIEVVFNPAWSEGQSRSLQIGLRSIQDRCEAAIFVLADMPDLAPGLLEALVKAHRRGLYPIVAPRAGDRLGNPVLFDAATFGALHELKGEIGGRALFHQYPPYSIPADETVLTDVDTPDDLQSLQELS